MSAAYCSLLDVKRRMTGDVPNMGPEFDQQIIGIISRLSAEFDREVRLARGQAQGWTFLAPVAYGTQLVMLSGSQPITGGTFTLTSGASTTVAIAYNASAATVQAALVTILGGGNVVVTGAPGGPWTVTFAGALSGLQPLLIGSSSLTTTPTGGLTGVPVQRLVDGAATSVTRRYTGRLVNRLDIDDAVSVSTVQILDRQGNVVQLLQPGIDYIVGPPNVLPFTYLLTTAWWWPDTPFGVQVTLTPGYCTVLPDDLSEAMIEEASEVYLAAQSTPDGRSGSGAFGLFPTSRDFSSRTWLMIESYHYGAAMLRGRDVA